MSWIAAPDGRSDDCDSSRKWRKRALASGIEKTFGLELCFELLESDLKRARSERLDIDRP